MVHLVLDTATLIQRNINSDTIWAFAYLCGDLRSSALATLRARTTNAKHKRHQQEVYDWLEANHHPGYKHADMAAEIEKLVPREYDTILKDITAWKRLKKEIRKR